MSLLCPGIAASRRPSRVTWIRWRQPHLYDALMRLPMALWCFLASLVACVDLLHYLQTRDQMTAWIFVVNIAMRLTTCGFLALMAASVVVRMRAAAKARGLAPRLAALLGSFLIYTVALLPRRELSPLLGIVSTSLTLIGTLSAIVILTQLGRSFSIMAEARQLVTSGIYRFVRHPLYLAEELALIGVAMQFASYWALLIVVTQIAFQVCRIKNEEAVLAKSFPEYEAYRRRTARLIPKVY